MVSSRDESTSSIVSNLGIQAGMCVAAHVVVAVFEKMLGSSYSKADIKRLKALKNLYTETLGRSTPVFWDLDDQDRPIFHIRDYKWSDYVRVLGQGRHSVHNYHYQSSLVAEDIATYLSERGKRWFGSGNPGDVQELLMGELIDFALNELPSLKYDEASIQKIKQRIKYIERVQNHPFLFKFGWLAPKRNRSDTLESVRQELIACVNAVKKELLRECAREKFKTCCDSTAGLLLATVRSVYYARATIVHNEAINLRRFLDWESAFITPSSKKLYLKLQKNHTGMMLLEAIGLAGLESFGVLGKGGKKPAVLTYFDEAGLPQSVNWRSRDFDLPPWLHKEEQQLDYLSKTQEIMQSLLRIAKLKKLVEEAYDLTGKAGELWAYGDQRGRLSLEGLLFLLDKELDLFFERYEWLHQFQDTQRKSYNLACRVNPDTGVNLNFSKVDEQYEAVDNFYRILKGAIKDIKDKMLDFSEDEVNRVDERKKSFYELVAFYVKQYYPADYSRFQLLEQQLSQEENDPAFGLDKPLLDQDEPSQRFSCNPFTRYCLGERYPLWKAQYFNQHRDAYLTLAKLLRQLDDGVNGNCPLPTLRTLAKEIQKQIAEMERNTILERPVWRFSLRGFSAGWPFNRRVHHYLDKVLQEFKYLSKEVKKSVKKETKERGQREQPNEALGRRITAMEQPPLGYGKRQEREVFYYQDNRNPFFQEPPREQNSYKGARQNNQLLSLSLSPTAGQA